MKKHEVLSNLMVATVLFVFLIVFGRVSNGEILQYSILNLESHQDGASIEGVISVDTDYFSQDSNGNYLIYNDRNSPFDTIYGVDIDFTVYDDDNVFATADRWGTIVQLINFDPLSRDPRLSILATPTELLLLEGARLVFQRFNQSFGDQTGYELTYSNAVQEYSFRYAYTENPPFGKMNRGWSWYVSGVGGKETGLPVNSDKTRTIAAVTPVPEPSTLALLVCGLAALTLLTLRKGG